MRLQGVPNLTGYLWHRRPMSFHGGSWCCCDHVASAFLGVWRGAWDSVGRTWSWYTAIIKHAGDLLPIGHYIPNIQHYCWSLDFVAAYRTWLQAFARRLQAEEGFFVHLTSLLNLEVMQDFSLILITDYSSKTHPNSVGLWESGAISLMWHMLQEEARAHRGTVTVATPIWIR